MSFLLIRGNWSFCFWLLHRSFVLSPCFSALISLLHWTCTLTSQRLFSRSRALTWSLLFALLQFALFAQSPAPFWSSAHSTMLIWSLVCMLPSAGPISLLFCAHSLAPQRSFAPFVALVHPLRPLRTFTLSVRVYKDRNPPFVIFNLCQRVPIEEIDEAFSCPDLSSYQLFTNNAYVLGVERPKTPAPPPSLQPIPLLGRNL